MDRESRDDQPSENPVLASVEPVVHHARWVFFNPGPLDIAVQRWGDSLRERPAWEHPCHYWDGTEVTVRWIFVLDILNFCFWPDPGKPVWTVMYGGSPHSGYWGLAASLTRAMEEGFPMTDANFLANLESETLEEILSGDGRIPLFEQRLDNLREAGRVLEREWRGDIVELVRACKGSGARVARSLASSFPSFRDEASYRGNKVFFWKRAQLFVSDLHSAFQGNAWGAFDDMPALTAFADYKLPQVLRQLGVLSLHPRLAERIDALIELHAGSEEEVEIRAATVHAVEAFREAFLRAGKRVTAAAVDNWLWQLGQEDTFRCRPYHRCRTIFY